MNLNVYDLSVDKLDVHAVSLPSLSCLKYLFHTVAHFGRDNKQKCTTKENAHTPENSLV